MTLEPNEWETGYDDRGVWVVQVGKMGSGGRENVTLGELRNDYGVVSDGHGFEDSPDCERISGGINSKGPYAVAIGRQANMMQWGFYAAPDRMTTSAKRAFLNAIVYMQQFDGRKPLVQKTSRGRSWYEQYVGSVRSLAKRSEASRVSYEKYLKGRFPAKLIADVGLDADALERWRRANVEYFHAEKSYSIVVDQELKKLGISNRKPEFLDWLTKCLRANPRDRIGLLLANRYLGDKAGGDAASALAFVAKNRHRLFFSDVGGYRWFVDTTKTAAFGAAPRPAGK